MITEYFEEVETGLVPKRTGTPEEVIVCGLVFSYSLVQCGPNLSLADYFNQLVIFGDFDQIRLNPGNIPHSARKLRRLVSKLLEFLR